MAYAAKYDRDRSVVCCGNVPRSILLSHEYHSDRHKCGEQWLGFVEAVGRSDQDHENDTRIFPLTKDSFNIKGESLYYTGMFLPYQVDILALTARHSLKATSDDYVTTYYSRRVPPPASAKASSSGEKSRSRRFRETFSESDDDRGSDDYESEPSDEENIGDAAKKADRRQSVGAQSYVENMEHFSAITLVPAPFLCKVLNGRKYLLQTITSPETTTEAFVHRLFYRVVFLNLSEPAKYFNLNNDQKTALFQRLAVTQIHVSVSAYKWFYMYMYTREESKMTENIMLLFECVIKSFIDSNPNDDHGDEDEENELRSRYLSELNQEPTGDAKPHFEKRCAWVRNFLMQEDVKKWKDDSEHLPDKKQFQHWTLVFFELDNRVKQYYAGHTVDLTPSKGWPEERSRMDYAAVLTADQLCFRADTNASSIIGSNGSAYKTSTPFQSFNIRCVYDHLLPLFLSRNAIDVVQVLNDCDLSLLQHMCDSSGLSLLELFDTHLVEANIRKTKKAKNRSTLSFQSFKLKPLSGFVQHASDPSMRRLAYGNSSEVGNREVVWVSNAVELCLAEVERSFTDNTFSRVTIQEETLLHVRRQSIVHSSFKSHMLSAALKKAASDCCLYLRRKSKFADELYPRIFPKDESWTAQTSHSYRTEDCDPFSDDTLFDLPEIIYGRETCNQPSVVRFLLHLHEMYYDRLCDSEQYLQQAINTYSYADLPEDVPSNARAPESSRTACQSFPFEMFSFEHNIDVESTYSSIPTPAFKDLIHFPNDDDARDDWIELFASCAPPVVSPILACEWTTHVADVLKRLREHRDAERVLICDPTKLHLVENVVKSLRASLLKWTRAVAGDSGVISRSFFNTERVMSEETAVTLSFWLAQMRNSSTRDLVVADWRRRWAGGFLLPNCVRYLCCENLFAETTRHTVGILCGAHLWSIVGLEMHLAILTISLKMISNVERRMREKIADVSGPCGESSRTCSYDVQMQTCRLVGMFAKRSTSVRDAKTFRSESERHEFHRLLDDGIVESKAKLESLLLLHRNRRTDSVPDGTLSIRSRVRL
ncbi:hypothetical protein CYMTET_2713 [Cymbomonas tetramitiformis]|uniref:Uncharacterized protein n=1 Tax=Cymbomonas tetramitiformis TaxID=36881 RepID=A0AAE0H4I2_9CHLO|nr:hypothetical protein CYMTET_2713 [Cymbomonas tetramitiformis]